MDNYIIFIIDDTGDIVRETGFISHEEAVEAYRISTPEYLPHVFKKGRRYTVTLMSKMRSCVWG